MISFSTTSWKLLYPWKIYSICVFFSFFLLFLLLANTGNHSLITINVLPRPREQEQCPAIPTCPHLAFRSRCGKEYSEPHARWGAVSLSSFTAAVPLLNFIAVSDNLQICSPTLYTHLWVPRSQFCRVFSFVSVKGSLLLTRFRTLSVQQQALCVLSKKEEMGFFLKNRTKENRMSPLSSPEMKAHTNWELPMCWSESPARTGQQDVEFLPCSFQKWKCPLTKDLFAGYQKKWIMYEIWSKPCSIEWTGYV